MAYRSQSSLEITSDLSEKGFPVDIVSRVIEELLDRGLLDNAALARDIILLDQRMNRGRARIYADLRKRGIERSLAEESLDEFYDIEMERKSIVHLLRQITLHGASDLDESQLNKITRKVSGRGFPPGIVRDMIREMTCDKEEDKAGQFP